MARIATVGVRVGTVVQQSTANCVNAGAGASADFLNLAITYGAAGSNNGNVTAEAIQNGSGFSAAQTYSEDAFNLLTQMTETSGGANQGYTYDQFGIAPYRAINPIHSDLDQNCTQMVALCAYSRIVGGR